MKTKIIKIHGCSGAGKTTAARALLTNSISTQKCYNAARKVEAYKMEFLAVDSPVHLLGSYDNNCGGMDTVSSAQAAMDLVEKYSKVGHVVHEGLLQSTYYGAMGTDSKRYGDRYIYAFLDTPIELCLERVVSRREAMGSTNKFNPQLTRDKHATIERLKKRLEPMGHIVATIYHDQPYLPQILDLL
jgi:adenylate kinase family enzyme